ncbi:MAG: hypothetical protein ACI9X4_000793 [Glaciecola sp.]|jgi:hypothetical protein
MLLRQSRPPDAQLAMNSCNTVTVFCTTLRNTKRIRPLLWLKNLFLRSEFYLENIRKN